MSATTLEVGVQVSTQSTREKHVCVCVTTCVEPGGKRMHAYVCFTYSLIVAATMLSNYFLDGNANLMVPGHRKEPGPGKLAENFAEVLSDGVGLLDVHPGFYPSYIL